MAENTGIEWADSTANLWMGCTKVSRACDHCYAERDFADRKKMVEWGPHGDRRYVKAGWKILAWAQKRAVDGIDPDLGRKRRVFVNSLSDFFDNHKSILPIWRETAFQLFEACPDVIIMLVTKRPQNVRKMVPPHWLQPGGWPAHVWLMVTAEDQEQAEIRVPVMLSLPVPVTCVSAEPLVGPIDFRSLRVPDNPEIGCVDVFLDALTGFHRGTPRDDAPIGTPSLPPKVAGLGWIIAGGESGPEAEPTHPAWVRLIRDQCAAAFVPFLMKQWGEWAPVSDIDLDAMYDDIYHPAPANAPEATRKAKVDQCVLHADGERFTGSAMFERPAFEQGSGAMTLFRIGKKKAGRHLDGVLHTEFPQAIAA